MCNATAPGGTAACAGPAFVEYAQGWTVASTGGREAVNCVFYKNRGVSIVQGAAGVPPARSALGGPAQNAIVVCHGNQLGSLTRMPVPCWFSVWEAQELRCLDGAALLLPFFSVPELHEGALAPPMSTLELAGASSLHLLPSHVIKIYQ